MKVRYVVHRVGVVAPSAPTGLVITYFDQGNAILDWVDNPEGTVTGYRVFRSVDGVSFVVIGTASTSNLTSGGLAAGTLYYFYVTALGSSGLESAPSAVVSGRDLTAPAAPTGLVTLSFTNTSVSLDWGDNTEADLSTYRIVRSVDDVVYVVVSAGLTQSNHVVTGLTANTVYYLRAEALDTSGNVSSRSGYVLERTGAQPGAVAAVVGIYDVNNVLSGYGPANDPEGVFFGLTTLANGDVWWIHTQPALATVTAFAGGRFTASGNSGTHTFTWRRWRPSTNTGVVGSKTFVM